MADDLPPDAEIPCPLCDDFVGPPSSVAGHISSKVDKPHSGVGYREALNVINGESVSASTGQGILGRVRSALPFGGSGESSSPTRSAASRSSRSSRSGTDLDDLRDLVDEGRFEDALRVRIINEALESGQKDPEDVLRLLNDGGDSINRELDRLERIEDAGIDPSKADALWSLRKSALVERGMASVLELVEEPDRLGEAVGSALRAWGAPTDAQASTSGTADAPEPDPERSPEPSSTSTDYIESFVEDAAEDHGGAPTAEVDGGIVAVDDDSMDENSTNKTADESN